MSQLAEDFVLPVDKPVGPTSHDVVASARRTLGRKRIGHTGTLDPFASGLLLLCVGRSTRLAEYLSGLDKEYEAVARLGQSTDTLDRDGVVTRERPEWSALDESAIEAALSRFVGEIRQVPPAYSAKKIEGERAYRRARRGHDVDLPPVTVRVHDIRLTALDLPRVRLRVTCSTGTYVRALARDLGEELGVGAHLVELRRAAIGPFRVEDALGLDDLMDPDRVAAASLTPLEALPHLPRLDVDDEAAERLSRGQAVPVAEEAVQGAVAVSHGGGLLAIGESSSGVLRPRKVFQP